jgi:hypothetical protein
VMHHAEREEPAHVEVILPMPPERYIEEQKFSRSSTAEFWEFMDEATWVSVPSAEDGLSDDEEYERAGWKLIRHCDVLLAVWDPGKGRRKGGTGDTLLHAAWLGKPCIWIPVDDPSRPIDNFGVDTAADFYEHVLSFAVGAELGDPPYCRKVSDVLAPLQESYRGLDTFNRQRLPPDFHIELATHLTHHPDRRWVAGPLKRASWLARGNRSQFWRLAIAISILAPAAALALGFSVSFGAGPSWRHYLALAEAVLLGAALLALWAVRGRKYHRHWLAYRVLAERLRSASYLARIGTDVLRTAGLQRVYVEHQPEDWLHRAFLEVWDGRPPHNTATAADPADLGELRWQLSEKWLGEQIRFYDQRAPGSGDKERAWSRVALAAFVLAWVAAVLHWLDIGDPSWVHNLSVLLSVSLPAAGASAGAIVTIAQFRARAERYERVASELAIHQARIRAAASLNGIASASLAAARTIAEETGDWFGAMWFLDLEHL